MITNQKVFIFGGWSRIKMYYFFSEWSLSNMYSFIGGWSLTRKYPFIHRKINTFWFVIICRKWILFDSWSSPIKKHFLVRDHPPIKEYRISYCSFTQKLIYFGSWSSAENEKFLVRDHPPIKEYFLVSDHPPIKAYLLAMITNQKVLIFGGWSRTRMY
jgi:hypothetical protein